MSLPEEGQENGQEGGKSPESDEGSGLAIEEAIADAIPRLKEPKHYAVVLHNDDYTTMEFVTEILQRFFHKTGDEAVRIMLKIHHEGKGVAGLYTYQIAETKVAQVQEYARSKGFPLKCTVEPAE